MNKARLIVLGLALTAGLAAVYLYSSMSVLQPVTVIQEATKTPMEQIIVASKNIDIGTLVGSGEMNWVDWPKEAVLEGMIAKSSDPNALADITGSTTRQAFQQGEPMRKSGLIKGSGGGYLAAMLPSGMRAVAITVDTSGNDYAGGFVLPNDHVDVVRSFRDEAATKLLGVDTSSVETLLQNVKVLAIGPNIQQKEGTRVLSGTNVTLELSPNQAELILLSSRLANSHLSLTLRSLADVSGQTLDGEQNNDSRTMTVVRYGVAISSPR